MGSTIRPPILSLTTPGTSITTVRMGKYDGVYKLESATHHAEFMAEMGISEADIKLFLNPKMVVTMSVMSNTNGSYTMCSQNSLAPHYNLQVTAKPGETKKIEKPFPCTVLWTKKSDTVSCQRMEFNGKVILSEFCWNNCGVTIHSSIEGSSVKSVERYCKVSPPVSGYYVLETEENLAKFMAAATSGVTAEMVDKLIKSDGLAFRVQECGDIVTITECFGDTKKEVAYKLDEAVEYSNKEFHVEDTRLLTKLCPGKYKMVSKNKKTGKVSEFTVNFTESGCTDTLTCGGVSATACYRRCPDIEGCWKVICMDGASAYLDACGIPEPMKSEMMAARDCHSMERLPGGRVFSKTTSKFFPSENVFKWDEQWEMEMPGLGTMRGVATELKDTVTMCMKFGGKTIAIKEKFSGDFLVQECEVDGCKASRMKLICVRQ